MSKRMMGFGLAFVFFSQLAGAAQPAPQNMGPVISGYLDAQAQWNRGALDLTSSISMPGNGTGFAVNQGAVMFSDEFEGAELTVDLPFRQSSTSGTSDNSLEVGTSEAQAFIKFQHDMGLFWQLGQFDSIVGIEPNDTAEIVLPQLGILHSFNPNTHTGVMIGYSFLPFFVNFVVGNANSTAAQSSEYGPQFVVRAGWSQEPMQASIAAMYTDSHGAYTLSSGEQPGYKPTIQLTGTFQMQIQKFELATEVDVRQSRQGVAQTVSGRKDHEMVFGFLVQGTYNFSDKWATAIRYEYLKNDETNEYVQSAQTTLGATFPTNRLSGQGGYLSKLALGVRHSLNEELAVKAGIDVNNLNIGRDNFAEGKTQGWIQGQVAAVYDF